MKPLSSNYIRPLATPELEKLACARFAYLCEVAEDEPARQQLRDSNVSESRIRSLYPFDFSEVGSSLAPMMTRAAFAHVDTLASLALVTGSVNLLTNSLPTHVRERVGEASSSNRAKVIALKLQAHVSTLLPIADESERGVAAATIVGDLWYATAGMEELEEIAPPSIHLSPKRRIALEAFLRITDLVLPQLRQGELDRVALDEWFVSRGAS